MSSVRRTRTECLRTLLMNCGGHQGRHAPKTLPKARPAASGPYLPGPDLKSRLEVGARQGRSRPTVIDGEGYLGSVAVEKATQGLEEAEACDRGGMRGAEGRGAASDGEQAEGIWRGSAGSLLRNG